MTFQKLNYIHENPVKAGIVFQPEQYKYSNAAQYAETELGLIPIELLL